MISKDFRLDFEALLSQIVDGQGFLHYGYWKDGTADGVSLRSIGNAQQAYFDELVRAIPDGTRSILDVGSRRLLVRPPAAIGGIMIFEPKHSRALDFD